MAIHADDFAPAPDLLRRCLQLADTWDELWYIREASLEAVWANVAVLGYTSHHPMQIFTVSPPRGPVAKYQHSLIAHDLGRIPQFLLICDRQRWEALEQDHPDLVEPTIHETLSRIRIREDPETGAPKLNAEGQPILILAREADASQGELTAKRYGLWHPRTHRIVAVAANSDDSTEA